jgi:acyl carrier protein
MQSVANASPVDATQHTPSTAQLLAVWQEVLGAPEVGADGTDIDENFFDAGGTSLTAARLAARIKTQLGCVVTAADILAHPSVRALAKKLAGSDAGLDRAASDRRAAMQRKAFTNPRHAKAAPGK